MQSVADYCRDNDAVDAPIPGCRPEDEIGKEDLDLALADPGLEDMEHQAMAAGNELIQSATPAVTPAPVKLEDAAERTLVTA